MSMIEQPSTEIFNYSENLIFNLSKLYINEYYIVFRHSLQNAVWLTYNNECHNCAPVIKQLGKIQEKTLSSKYSEKWQFTDGLNAICDIEPNVAEFGCYEMDISNCILTALIEPVNIGLPILTVILIFLAVAVPIVGGIYGYNKFIKKSKEDEPKVKKDRVRSLDTFRGISITLMILVNYGGGGYNFLEHAVWNGLTLADVVFPWFLWIMGVCIPISIKSAMRRGDHIFWHIVKRSAILFMLGIIVNGIDVYSDSSGSHMNIYYLRIFGVLQRFGLCYIVTASTCLLFMKKEFPETPGKFQDIIVMLPQWVVGLLCIVVHTALTFGLEIPDCPVVGYLGPGGRQGDEHMTSYGEYMNCTGGAVGYIDRKVLGEELMYKNLNAIYGSAQPVDPEGIIGTFNAIFQVFLGVQAGMTLLMYKKGHIGKVFRWLIWGVISGIIGGGLCGFSQEDGVIPINKTLWSLSFVFSTTCLAFILLSFLYVVIDAKKFWSGKPFLFAGMNSTILYVGQALTYGHFPFQWGVLEPSFHFQLLAQAVWGTMMWWIVAYWLYKIQFFLSI